MWDMPSANDLSRGRLYVALATAGFGSMAIFGKLSYADGANVVTTLAVRFAVGALLLWALLLGSGQSPRVTGRQGALLLALGVCGFGGVTGSFFSSLRYIPASLTSLLFFTYPVYLALLTALFGGEGLVSRQVVRPRQVLALITSLAGATLTLAGPAWAGIDPTGVYWALAAAWIHAAYLFLASRHLGDVPSPVLIAYITAAAAGAYLAVGALTGTFTWGMGPRAWGSILAMGILSTAWGLRLLWTGIRLIGVNRAALITTMEPLVTTALAVLVLGESWGLRQAAGTVLILLGVWAVPGRQAAPRRHPDQGR